MRKILVALFYTFAALGGAMQSVSVEANSLFIQTDGRQAEQKHSAKKNSKFQSGSELSSISPIRSKAPDINPKKIEASGILWFAKTAQYILISDEKYNHHPGLYIMDETGWLISSLSSKVEGFKIDDLESISAEGNTIYILSSLSHNKKNKLKNKRKKLLRFKYIDGQVGKPQNVDLYQVLSSAKNGSDNNPLSQFLQRAIDGRSMDIESHFVEDDNLYLGFKSPYEEKGETMILKVYGVEAMFQGKVPRIEIWQTILLRDETTGKPMRLSDMIKVNNQLLLLAVSSENNSALWRYPLNTRELETIKHFSGLKAEGVTYHSDNMLLTIVFDEGKKKRSKYLNIPYLF